jgi:hypothetical protein
LNMWPSNHTQIYQFPEKKPSKSGLIEVWYKDNCI